MSTLTLRHIFPMQARSGSTRDGREESVREAMKPRRERIIALTGGAIAVTLFSVLAPMVGAPAERLFALDRAPRIPTVDAIAVERPFELMPTMMGPAISSEALMLAGEDATYMPRLEVRATPPVDEIVCAPKS